MTNVTENTYTGLEVAVIGMACHFPGAEDWRSYWKNLENGFEAVEKLDKSSLHNPEGNKENFVGARIVLQNKDLFDSDFFDYRPAEATLMNPLHRIFHECVWEALEDAGYDPYQSKDLIGLYAGGNENLNWKLFSIIENSQSEIDNYTLEYLNSKDYLASLVAYKLNFKGPVVSINTACSTTLVTINMAYKSLLMGETDLALAGGISIVTQEQNGYFYEEGMIASKDGHCRAFDKAASGTVRGEGAGVVVLKRLVDAIRDGDNVYAVIKGAAINNDGKQKVGFTAPAVEGQAECIKRAQKFAKVPPESISYIEAHGTGTRLGDLIEIEALNIAFNHNTNHQCAIGSVKSNLGHLDTAAGIAGFIKTVLSLKNKKIPASLHFTDPNPEISFNQGPFYVNPSLAEWQVKGGLPRRAGVSSFGIGGTNAHVILEEAPIEAAAQESSEYHLLVLSARSEDSLKRYIRKLKDFLTDEFEVNLNDLCYTLREGRRQFEFRKSFVFSSRESLLQSLNAKSADENIQYVADLPAKVVFLFPGQGSQYLNMGKGIYESNFLFKEIVDEGFEKLAAITGEDFKCVLYSDNPADDRIYNTRYTQPLLFLFEYALSRLLILSGISPDYLIGHSIGEYTAAAISGVFSFSDALKIVNCRAEILDAAVTGGLMLSANISEELAISYLNEQISLAAVNGPNQVVFSGHTSSIEALAKTLLQHQIEYTYLKTSHAFHSYMLDSVVDKFRMVFDEVKLNAPVIPFISNVTGRMIDPKDAVSPSYWIKHMRSTVRFSEGLTSLSSVCERVRSIEVGPGKVLSNLINDHNIFNQSGVPISLVRNKYNKDNDLKYFIQQAGKLWETGCKPEWSKLLCVARGKRISLPTYSFDWKRYPTEVNSLEEEIVVNRRLLEKQQSAQKLPAKWMYYASWRRSIFKKYSRKIQSFLFFSTGDEFAEKLITELKSRGHSIVEVVPGETYSKVNGRKYNIRPGIEADYKELINDILKEKIHFTDVIYSWATQANDRCGQIAGDGMQLNLLYFGIVYSVRSLAKNENFKNVNFIVFTKSLHRVLGVEEIHYQQSLALGLLPSIQAEYGVSCFSVDFLEEEKDSDLVTVLVKELEAFDYAENCIALRHGQKWARIFQPLTDDRTDGMALIKEGGIYIITGGLGNVGFSLAKYLLKKYRARLVLTGRKDMSVLQENDLEKVERLKELTQLSGDVFYYNIDISDLDAVGEMAEELEQKHGTIDGIIHAAGITDGRYFDFIDDMTPENAMILFSPKVNGIENIYKVYGDRKLDFVWVTSSISSVLGSLGYAAYAAANSYANYFISAKSAQVKNWVSIGLSELAFTGNEISNMPQALNPDELCEVFDHSLHLGVDPVLYQCKRDIQIITNKNNNVGSSNFSSLLSNGNVDRQTFKSRRVGVEYIGPLTETEKRLVEVFENFFGIEKIGIDDNFFELGGDSLKGMILLKRITAAFEVNLQLADFLKNPDIRSLALKVDQMIWFGSDNPMKYEILI